jgi:hypothetical protein
MSVEVTVLNTGKCCRADLRSYLPPQGKGGLLYFTSEWDIEPVLDALRVDFPRLRYQIQEVGDMSKGVRRVYINRRNQKKVTRRAKRRISLS